MSNINKILITVVVCVFMICVASVSIVKIVTRNNSETTTAVTTSDSSVQKPSVSAVSTVTPTEESNNTALPTQTTEPTNVNEGATTTTRTPAVSEGLGEDLLGKWMDSAGMSGYEFFADGSVNMTYVNLAQFNIPFDGTAKGVYTLEGDTLTVKFSIYTATIKNTYKINIEGNALSMFNLEEFSTSTYARVS